MGSYYIINRYFKLFCVSLRQSLYPGDISVKYGILTFFMKNNVRKYGWSSHFVEKYTKYGFNPGFSLSCMRNVILWSRKT